MKYLLMLYTSCKKIIIFKMILDPFARASRSTSNIKNVYNWTVTFTLQLLSAI